MTVDIFIPCLIDQFFPETGMNMIKVLEKSGVKVQYNSHQTCCGQGAFMNGFWEDAKHTGEKFIHAFEGENYIVGPSTTCVAYVRNHYDKHFYNSGLHMEFKKLKKRIYEFSDFMVSVLNVENTGSVLEEKAVLHGSCAGSNRYGMGNQPEILLKNVRGLELAEINDVSGGCGYQGMGPGQLDKITERLLKSWCHNVMEAGASTVIVLDGSCMLNFTTYIQKQKLPLKVMHIADVLAAGL